MNGVEKTRPLPDTVAFNAGKGTLDIIDQTLLPGRLEVISLNECEDIYDAIKSLKVRGAPAIGAAAAIGIFVCVKKAVDEGRVTDSEALFAEFSRVQTHLAASRPTAVNLFWALGRMERALKAASGNVAALLGALEREALSIRDEDVSACRRMGELALTLLDDGDSILTHCNAGQLATVRYGTALSPLHIGREKGYVFHVYCDETRPLHQGSRLSAYELLRDGIDTSVICDNMASSLMKNKKIDAVIVGADRIAANYDVCNKIGTSGLAIIARHYGVPFYVVAPTSTFDRAAADGSLIPIEQRAPEEVTELWFSRRMAPEGVGVYNPAFDVTPHELVDAIITEEGIIRPNGK